MLERPAVTDASLAETLRLYGLSATRIEFLPIGNDASAYSFRADCGQDSYFLKLKIGGVDSPALLIPRYLRDIGIAQVVAPLPAWDGSLFVPLGDDHLSVYPFILGRSAMQAGMSAAQWTTFGDTLRKIHAAQPPEPLASKLRREDFHLNPAWMEAIQTAREAIRRPDLLDSHARELAAFWRCREEEIEAILAQAQDLGRAARTASPDFVLCHSDIHTANIMLDPSGGLHIIDWDQPLLAPRERDLMFIAPAGPDHPEARWFYTGYGAVQISPLILAYYAFEWVVQEIGDYARRVFMPTAYGEATLRDSLRGFRQLFDPGDVVEEAHQALQRSLHNS